MTDSEILYWISDFQLERELSYYIRRRELEQKFLYLGEGAKNYYNAYGPIGNGVKEAKKMPVVEISYGDFFMKHRTPTSEKFYIISLGCGNAFQEKPFVTMLTGKGYKFTYIGVDSSKTMLELASKNLSTEKGFEKIFICADFTESDFEKEICNITGVACQRYFGFFGCTFGNTNQTSITDLLYNMLAKDDVVWFDVLSRNENGKNIELKLFERYAGYLQNNNMNKFQFSALEKIGIPYENGKIVLETSNEESIGAVLFTFSFVFTQKTVVTFRNEVIHILPNEKINLLTIRNYDTKLLEHFFGEHNFKLVAKENIPVNDWLMKSQFMFGRDKKIV